MAEQSSEKETTVVERWLAEQQHWQRTVLTYLDSLVKNDDFLVHLGNAMRGSLLAGKPYPGAPAPAAQPAQDPPADDRLDRVLFALHEMQGQLSDLRLTVDELRNGGKESPAMPRVRKPASAKARSVKAPLRSGKKASRKRG